jgi:hypothetical protein
VQLINIILITQNISTNDKSSIISRSVVQSFSRSVVSITLIVIFAACRDESRPIDLIEKEPNPSNSSSKNLIKSNCGKAYRDEIIRIREDVKKLN